jgi:STE24 endopeptidase
MSATAILATIIAIVCVGYATDRLLELLNLRRMRPELPDRLKAFYDAERYARSQQYQRERLRFGLLGSTLSFLVTLVVLATGLLGALDTWLRTMIDSPYWLMLSFFGIMAVANDIMGMPFSLYSTFVIEAKYGFNKTTLKTWLLDKLKGALVGAVLGALVMWVFIWLAEIWKEDFWIWFWIAIAAFTLLAQFLFTSVFLPLFNKLTPLEAGPLRSAIEEYSLKVGFPLGNILVMDGSRRSSKANAFFSGFGSQKKIVLFDTLLAQMSQPEILAVLAHEVGHYKKRHVVLGTALGVLQMGVMLFILSRMLFAPTLSLALGAETAGLHLGLIAFTLLFSPISQLTGLGMNLLSRKNEYEADAFARATYAGDSLENALIKLHVENLSNLEPHPVDVFLNYSHPTLLQRIAALRS